MEIVGYNDCREVTAGEWPWRVFQIGLDKLQSRRFPEIGDAREIDVAGGDIMAARQ